MTNWLTRRKIAARSIKARERANRRWELDHARRDTLAAKDPAFTGLRIIRRIIVIDRELSAREAVIYECDSARSARRKLRGVLYPAELANQPL